FTRFPLLTQHVQKATPPAALPYNPTVARVFIGIGSNLGDRAGHLRRARFALAQIPQTRLVAFRDILETEPVGPIAQDRFLNAVAELHTTLSPAELRAALVQIEEGAGREPVDARTRWGPRVLDLDILLYDDRIVDDPELRIPHPRMHERLF